MKPNFRAPTDQKATEHPRKTLRLAFGVGLAAGLVWVVGAGSGGGVASAASAAARAKPVPEAPRVLPLRTEGQAVGGVAKGLELAPKAIANWTIPAAEIDPRHAQEEGAALVQHLEDGTAVELTIDPALQRAAEDSLARYRVGWGAVVAIRPSTGEILALAEHAEGRPDLKHLALQSAAPAASIFKIITAAALMADGGLTPESKTCTHGGASKLTLYHLKPNARRDTKCETLAEALGSSNNTAFARWADQLLKPAQLEAMARRFGFGARIPFMWQVGVSSAVIPSASRLGYVRSAAGFEGTTLSPLHAALIAGAIGNGGTVMAPQLVRRATRPAEGDREVFQFHPTKWLEAVSPEVAAAVGTLMEATITSGTGRKFFEKKGVPRLGNVRVAGKSGTLSGHDDEAALRNYSWFVAYGRDGGEAAWEGGAADIAVAALIVEGEQWTVKGAVPVRDLLEAFFARGKGGAPPARRAPVARQLPVPVPVPVPAPDPVPAADPTPEPSPAPIPPARPGAAIPAIIH